MTTLAVDPIQTSLLFLNVLEWYLLYFGNCAVERGEHEPTDMVMSWNIKNMSACTTLIIVKSEREPKIGHVGEISYTHAS